MIDPAAAHAAIVAGDRRAIGRLISAAENRDPAIAAVLASLYRAGGRARTIGITGPPGAGKSTLTDRIVTALRAREERVAVLAVDPSSPLSGGAVLGDRVRMNAHAGDPGVLIRSMAARGALGGLAAAAADAVTILDTAGFDTIVIETVGVGQSEVDIAMLADLIVVVQTSHGGDGVQTVKAGVLEIADIVVVNKCDSPGSDRTVRSLATMLAHRAPTLAGWEAPALATEATSCGGVEALMDVIDRYFGALAGRPDEAARRRSARLRARIAGLVAQGLNKTLREGGSSEVDALLAAVAERRIDPHDAAARIASSLSELAELQRHG